MAVRLPCIRPLKLSGGMPRFVCLKTQESLLTPPRMLCASAAEVILGLQIRHAAGFGPGFHEGGIRVQAAVAVTPRHLILPQQAYLIMKERTMMENRKKRKKKECGCVSKAVIINSRFVI